MKIFSLLLLFLLLVFSGCTTIGREFPSEPIPSIKKGVTHIDDIKKLFGNPARVGVEYGKLVWTYIYYSADIFGGFDGKDLLIKFNDKNIVLDYSYSTTDFKEKLILNRAP